MTSTAPAPAAPALATYLDGGVRQADVVALSGTKTGVTTVTRRDTGAVIGTVTRLDGVWYPTDVDKRGLGNSYGYGLRQAAVSTLIERAVLLDVDEVEAVAARDEREADGEVAADKVLVEGPRTRTPEELAAITDEEREWVEAENERFIVFGEVEVAAARAARRQSKLDALFAADVQQYLDGPALTDPHLVRLRELGEVELADRQATELAKVAAERLARSRDYFRNTARRAAEELVEEVAEGHDRKVAESAIEVADNVASLHTVRSRHAGRGPAVKLVGVKLTQAELDDLDALVEHLGAYAGGDRSSALRWAVTTLGTLARAAHS